jgi:hypothetical protein
MDIRSILLTPVMVDKIREFQPDFEPINFGFEVLYSNDLPLNNEKLNYLTEIRHPIIGEDEEGCAIYDTSKILSFPPIYVRKIADKYQVLNGRHRVVHCILNNISFIKVKIC